MLGISGIVRIFEEIEQRLVKSLKRNLGRHKEEEEQEGFNWSAWQAEKLRGLEKFRRENAAIMQEYTEQIDTETRQIMQEQFDEGMNGVDVPPAEPVPDVPAEIRPEPQFFGVDTTKVNKLIEDVTHLEKNAETAALRLTDDVYRQTVNRVQLAMGTGSMTLQQAIDIAVKDFLDNGVNCIVYRDGRRVNIADYVRMALRTTATRAALQGKSAKYKALGYDTVQVSSYGMCSKTCEPWQGRIYIEDTFSMWDGEVREQGGILWGKSNYCGKWFPLLSSAIEKGLFHPNCRHSISLWRDGDPLPESVDNSDSERRYKLEQQQRALEREIRKAKRKVNGFTDPENIKKAKAELRQAQKELKDFIDKVNAEEGETVLRRDEGKEKVYEGEVPASTPNKPYTEVQDEYEANATPGEGAITCDSDYNEKKHKEEIDFADWLHNKYGGDIHIRQEHRDKEYCDYIWRGKYWELKSPKSQKGTNSALRKGYSQVSENTGGVMIDYGEHDIDLDFIMDAIEERMHWYHGDTIDIMLVHRGKVLKILRYKKR